MNTSSTTSEAANDTPFPATASMVERIAAMHPSESLMFRRSPRPHPAGKIARLPAVVREQINEWIEDNLSYADIISRLEAQGHPGINKQNLSNWAGSGYEIWLRKRESLDIIRLQSEANREIIDELQATDPAACARLNQRFMAIRLAQLTQALDMKLIKDRIEADPGEFFRLARSINAQARSVQREQKLQMQLSRQQQSFHDPISTPSQPGYDGPAAGLSRFVKLCKGS
jgi:hypothetical protein